MVGEVCELASFTFYRNGYVIFVTTFSLLKLLVLLCIYHILSFEFEVII